MASPPVLLNAEEKELLLSRYKDLEFVSVDEECKCGRCERVMIHHYFSQCGHAYCRNCKNILDGGRWKCSQCDNFVTQIDEQRSGLEIKVNALLTSCPNKKYGCDVQSNLNAIPKHLKTCENTRESALPVEICNDSDIKVILKKLTELNSKFDAVNNKMTDMEEKIEMIKNKNQSLEIEIKSIQEVQTASESKMKENEIELQNVIKKVSVPPKKSVTKDALQKRLKLFKDELDISKLASAISEKNEAEAKLKLVEEQMKSHENLLLEEGKRISEAIQELKNKLDNEDYNIKEAPAVAVNRDNQINNHFQKQMKRIEYKFEARAISIEDALLFKGIQLNVCSITEVNSNKWQVQKWEIPDINNFVANETCIFQNFNIAGLDFVLLFNPKQGSIRLNSATDVTTQNKVKKMKLFPRVNFVIKDKKKNKNKNNEGEKLDIVKSQTQALYSNSYQTNLSYDVFIDEFSKLDSRYKRDNKMELEVHVEPAKIYKQFYSNNGILMSKIADYKACKTLEAKGCAEGHLSPYFYTSDMGHRVQVEVKLNAKSVQNNQSALTVSIMFLPGIHKPGSKWSKDDPFHHKTTVTIYNQKTADGNLVQNVKKICKTESDWESKYALEFLFSSRKISEFIRNNSLYYKLEIINLEI